VGSAAQKSLSRNRRGSAERAKGTKTLLQKSKSRERGGESRPKEGLGGERDLNSGEKKDEATMRSEKKGGPCAKYGPSLAGGGKDAWVPFYAKLAKKKEGPEERGERLNRTQHRKRETKRRREGKREKVRRGRSSVCPKYSIISARRRRIFSTVKIETAR